MTPLILSTIQGQTEVVKALLVVGADVNLEQSNGRTALSWSITNKRT